MATNSSDDNFARNLLLSRVVTPEQVDAAKDEQRTLEQSGEHVSLADMLIRQGMITPAIRANVEKMVQTTQGVGIQSLGQYKLLKKIGEGGMGIVYLAEDTVVGRKVALKVLPKRRASDAEFLTRFKREAKSTGKLNHENIVTAFTIGEEKGFNYYVMEYCDGEPLDKLLSRDHVLSWDKATGIAIQVARGLQHAHEHGILHRDIKPGNIFITTAGVAKILDMGLSKNMADQDAGFNTASGMALGTPHYISPEQARGDRIIDGRTDIYSLGATLYNLVTGETPFEGPTAAVIMMKHLNESLPNPQDIRDDIPEGLCQTIQKMMAKEPEDRYRNCGELLADLELIAAGKTPASKPMGDMKSSVAKRSVLRSAADAAVPRLRPSPSAHVSAPRHVHPARPLAQPAQRKFNVKLILAGFAATVLLCVVGYFVFRSTGKQDERAETGKTGVEIEKHVTHPGPTPVPVPGTTGHAAVQPPLHDPKNDVAQPPDEWIRTIQKLPAEGQLAHVIEALMKLNPGYEGQRNKRIEDEQVTELVIKSDALVDISPLRALTALRKLKCEGNFDQNNPQRGRNLIADLSPLKHMPLTVLGLAATSVVDLSPLKHMQLTDLDLSGTFVSDLSPLKGMPLKHLNCMITPVAELAPLAGTSLETLNIHATPAKNLTPLAGHKLKILQASDTKIDDLSPLKNMPIANLDVSGTFVADLSPLKSMPIDNLNIKNTRIADYTPLLEIPQLKTLYIDIKDEATVAVLKELHTLDGINGFPYGKFSRRFAGPATDVPVTDAPEVNPPKTVTQDPKPAPQPAAVPPPTPPPPPVQLLAVDFKDFDPRKLPAGWLAPDKKQPLGVLEMKERGKVLQVINKDEIQGKPRLEIPLDIEKVKGRMVRFSAMAFAPKGFVEIPGTPWANPRINLEIIKQNGKVDDLGSAQLEATDRDWKRLTFDKKVPADAQSAKICLKSYVRGEALFDDLAVHVFPPRPKPPNSEKILVDEDFEAMDLDDLPSADWRISNRKRISVVEFDKEHGHVLRIENRDGKLDLRLDINLDIEKVRGKKLSISALICCPEGYAASQAQEQFFNKPRIILSIVDNNDERKFAGRVLDAPGKEWKRISFDRLVPADTKSATVSLSVTNVVADAYFDDLRIEVEPDK